MTLLFTITNGITYYQSEPLQDSIDMCTENNVRNKNRDTLVSVNKNHGVRRSTVLFLLAQTSQGYRFIEINWEFS